MSDTTAMQYYRFIFQSTSDGIIIAKANIIEQVNPAASVILGIMVDDLIGQPVEQVFRQQPALLNLFTRGGDQMLDVRLPKRRLAVGIATTLSEDTRIVLLQDVTEKQELESRREALITTMAHDLRNPISALSGFAELVEKFGELNPQQARFMTRIRQTASKLYDVVESLVDLAWIEAGMPLAHRPIELNHIIQHVVNDLGHLALGRKIAIAVSVQDPLPNVMGDAERIQLAIYNLLHNAILYSEPEQSVGVHAWGDEQEVYLSVADRGIGISDDELELVFDRLYRSRDERIRDMPGGGLGLTIARTIINRHGGAIWASSNLGAGSTFTIVLPAVQV